MNQPERVKISHKHASYLKLERDKDGNYIFSFRFAEKLPQGELVEVQRLTPAETDKQRKLYKQTYESYNSTKGQSIHRLMGYLAFKNKQAHEQNQPGVLDGKLSEQQIQEAAQNIIPQGFDIHHLLPISLGGKSAYDNLFLIEKETHRNIHHCMDCVLAYIPYKQKNRAPDQPKFFIRLPRIDKCLTNECGLFQNEMAFNRNETDSDKSKTPSNKKVIREFYFNKNQAR